MKKYVSFLVLAVLVVAIQICIGAALWHYLTPPATAAEFGDMFGAVNTLFAGLAFAGVIYAIILQQQELALQREELKETRKELHRSAQAQEKSEKALREQVDVAKQQAEAVIRPYVSIRLAPTATGNSIRLIIANTGQTAAQNLRLRLDGDFHPIGYNLPHKSNNLADLNAFISNMPTFSPGSSLEFPIASLILLDEPLAAIANHPNARLEFSVNAIYEFPGRKVQEVTHLDLRPLLESEMPVSDPAGRALERMARSLGKMEKSNETKSIASELREIKSLLRNKLR